MQNRTKFVSGCGLAACPARVDFADAISYKPANLPPTDSLPLSAGMAVF
jgi:hypothetical protein